MGDDGVGSFQDKVDLEGPLDAAEVGRLVGADDQETCALTGRGIEDLRRRVFDLLVGGEVPPRDAAVVTTPTVALALEEAAGKLEAGKQSGPLLDESLLE